ncbi:hypothetical protein ACFV9C_42065 [Kribbella sp. NPDC059898]|uniref:hypothetical protein n=1 Tax=Kribbella sp. NPDC059898 TaxID=3346995 RepID=UPI003655EF2E
MTNHDYDAAAEWAEHDMELPANSKTALRGDAAATFGRELLERSSGGRPTLDPNAPGAKSPVRQTRLPRHLDAGLVTFVDHNDTTISEVFRDALGSYLDPDLIAYAEQRHLKPAAVLREAIQEYLDTHRRAG